MTDHEKLEKLRPYFVRKVVNAHPSYEIVPMPGKERIPRLYRREDFTRWAKEAFDRGEDFFYCEPVDPEKPNGAQRLCGIKYEYVCNAHLTEDFYKEIFGEYDYTKVPGDYRNYLDLIKNASPEEDLER